MKESRRKDKENRQRLVFTCVIIKLLENTVHPVLAADRALLRSHWQAGEPRPQEHWLGRHLVDLSKQLSVKCKCYSVTDWDCLEIGISVIL